MSHDDTAKIKHKTVRLSAIAYYKLAELTGLVAVIRGKDTSISEIASEAITILHQYLYPFFLNVINNPKELLRFRDEFQNNSRQISELVKNIKIKE